MARLRLLFALLLVNVGTWFGALALSGYYEPHTMMHTEPSAALIGSPDASQFISLLSRERFVVVDDQVIAAPTKPKAAKPAAKAKLTIADKRPQQAAAQWPWPLSLLGK